MRAIIAAAQTEDEVNEIWTALTERTDIFITYADITGTQITVVYEAIQAQEDIKPAEEPATKKTRKQPTVRDLQQKAKKLFCDDLDIYRENDRIVIASDWAGVESVTCKTTTGASRKITAIYWERQIKRLRAQGLIA